MIEVTGLGKNYGSFEAVKDVSFSVGQGEVLGFLGPNGAGKTTIMKVLTGFHFPSRGSAVIDGIPVTENPGGVKERIGYLPESVPLYGDLTPAEYLSFMADARLISGLNKNQALEKALLSCGLEKYRNKRIDTLSKGYRQRVGLAQAIIHDPPILILDEPTSGLDPNQIIEIRSLIRELGKSKTVILSTHILQEAEAVCSQVLIINKGVIAAQGTAEEIAAAMKGGDTWDITVKGASAETLKSSLENAPWEKSGVSVEALPDGLVRAGFVMQDENGERIFDWAVEKGLKILRMNLKRVSLEDIFVKLTKEEQKS
jgi:ABC-2 type transport system ATP-binding protein